MGVFLLLLFAILAVGGFAAVVRFLGFLFGAVAFVFVAAVLLAIAL